MGVYEAIAERDKTVPARPDHVHIWYVGVGLNTRVWLVHTWCHTMQCGMVDLTRIYSYHWTTMMPDNRNRIWSQDKFKYNVTV